MDKLATSTLADTHARLIQQAEELLADLDLAGYALAAAHMSQALDTLRSHAPNTARSL